jgi:hypothetical protein
MSRCKNLIGKRVRVVRDIVLRSGKVVVEGMMGKIEGVWRGKYTIIQYATAGVNGRGWVVLLRHVGRDAFDVI